MTEKAYWLPQRMVLWRGQLADALGVRSVTQQRAAELLDVSRRQIINWETGRSPINRRVALACNFIRQNARRLSPVLGVDFSKTDELARSLESVERVQMLVNESQSDPDLLQPAAGLNAPDISYYKPDVGIQGPQTPDEEYSPDLANISKKY
ncbi:MAG: helix-turn-helix domain-containing protein [Sphingomonadales bacterium]|nr:helix-turn-helix domain-containing protein [Sphingomonadales bacterium]